VSAFERRGELLLCEQVPLGDAAARFGTPLYLYSRAAVLEAWQAYAVAFAGVPHRVCYALKANGSGALLRLLASLGAGADIVSGFELLAALRAGFPPERIVFAGVGKSEAELRLALERGIDAFNVESRDELLLLSALANGRGRPARVGLRVNPDIDARSHPYISTGLRESKFGVAMAEAPGLLEEARRLPGLRVVGVQCHIGSQVRDLGAMEESARGLVSLSRALLADGFPLETIDIGGGLAVDYEGTGQAAPALLAERVVPLLEELPLTLLLEPGRSLVAGAGVLLTRVLYVKRSPGRTFVIVDAGMNDLLRPSLYGAFHRIEPVVLRAGPFESVDVVGPVCESGDFLARERALPPLVQGDLIAVRDVGAYGFCMSSNYNMRPRAAEALVEADAVRLVRRRETFEDIVASEVG
jgi:diaminopimelate decarboxylase